MSLEAEREIETAQRLVGQIGNLAIFVMLILIGINFVVWIRPYLKRMRTVVIAGTLFEGVLLIYYYVPLEWGIGKASIATLPIVFVYLWLAERELVRQKAFLCVMFLALYRVMAGLLTEITFAARDVIYTGAEDIRGLLIWFGIDRFFWVLLGFLLLFFAIAFLHRILHPARADLTTQELILLLILPVTILLSSSIFTSYVELYMQGIDAGYIESNVPADPLHFLFYVFSDFAILAECYFFAQNRRQQERLRENAVLERQTEELRQHIQRAEELYTGMRELRHDIGNHILTMEHLIEGGAQSEASEYARRVREEYAEAAPEVRTGNPVTDAVLTEKKRLAEGRELIFWSEFYFPAESGIDAFDISVILHNALDNAIRAAKSKISIESRKNEEIFLITVQNDFDGNLEIDPASGLPRSTKPEAGHGMGLGLIRRIAEQYGGGIRISQKGGEVVLCVMMQGK